MTLDRIIGNEDVRQAFATMAQTGRVPHALMLHENEGGGALALALGFITLLSGHEHYEWNTRFTFPISSGSKVSGAAKDLTCDDFAKYWRELMRRNPYFLENELSEALGIEKKSGVIAVAEGKVILQKLSLAAPTAGYRFMVIWLPEKMNRQTANMLLKSIEEPTGQTVFILITHNPEEVLTTIASRCQRMRVVPLSAQDVERTLTRDFGIGPEEAAEAAALSGGSVGVALHSLSEESGTALLRELFVSLLDSLLKRDLPAALEVGETLAALESREKQKAFCQFAGEQLRKIFMLQQGMDGLALIPPREEAFYRDAAARCSRDFCRRGTEILGRTRYLLDRNVGQKILFCNLVTRLSVII